MTTLSDIDRLAGHTREVSDMTNEPLLLLSEAAELLHVDTHCLGCAMEEDDMMRAEIARLTGEIDRLRSIIEDCNPYLKDGEIPADRIRRDIRDNDALMSLLAAEKKIRERITGENAVLRDLLRDCADVIDTIAPENSDKDVDLESLIGRIAAALNGPDSGLFDGGAK